MNTLAEQQRSLKHAITAKAGADLLRAQPEREPLLRIYQQAYEARLSAALRDNFGVLPLVMGDASFEALARGYIAAHPSRHPSIRWFGDKLADFMAEHGEWVPHPALVDLARMEWALRSAFDAEDSTPMGAAELASQPPEAWPSLVFRFCGGVQLLRLQWAVEPIWRALQDAAPQAGSEPELPEPAEHGHMLMIWRSGLETRWRGVPQPQGEWLAAALGGVSFAELCTLAAQRVGEGEAATALVAALQGWIADGLLAQAARR